MESNELRCKCGALLYRKKGKWICARETCKENNNARNKNEAQADIPKEFLEAFDEQGEAG